MNNMINISLVFATFLKRTINMINMIDISLVLSIFHRMCLKQGNVNHVNHMGTPRPSPTKKKGGGSDSLSHDRLTET